MTPRLQIALALYAVATSAWDGQAYGQDYPITYGGYLCYEEFAHHGLDTKTLVAAPLIVAGTIEAFTYVGEDSLWARVGDRVSGSPESRTDVYEALISVERVIAGSLESDSIRVEACLVVGDDSNDSLQELLQGAGFVFFLARDEKSTAWKGVDPLGFALRFHTLLPEENRQERNPAEKLRQIAHANIRTADERCAVRWFRFLASQYDPAQDREVCLEVMDDFRPHVRGKALALLCRHHPETPGLYEKALAHTTDWFQPAWRVAGLSGLLYPVLAHHKPDSIDDELRRWLDSDSRDLRKSALTAIREKRRTGLLANVVDYLAKVEKEAAQYAVGYQGESSEQKANRKRWSERLEYERYDCYKTLCRLRGKTYTATDLFFQNSDAMLAEFRRFGTAKQD